MKKNNCCKYGLPMNGECEFCIFPTTPLEPIGTGDNSLSKTLNEKRIRYALLSLRGNIKLLSDNDLKCLMHLIYTETRRRKFRMRNIRKAELEQKAKHKE